MLIKFDNGTEVEFDVYDAETADVYTGVKKVSVKHQKNSERLVTKIQGKQCV